MVITPSYFLGNKLSRAQMNMKVESNTYQSVEAHLSTASRPVLIFWQISPSISEDCMILKTWLITEDSLRIRPMTTHQSRHPASMKICSRYLYGKKSVYFSTPKTKNCTVILQIVYFSKCCMPAILSLRGRSVITYLSCTCDLCGPLLASSRESCSSSDWVKLRLEKFSSTIVQSPSTIELVSVRSVAEPMLHSSPTKNTQKHKGKKKLLTLVRLRISELLPIKTDKQ